MTTSAPDDPYRDGFNPAQYLRMYYAAAVTDDERQVFTSLFDSLKGQLFDRCLEVGCGPTLHHAVPLVPHVREIHMSDYLPDNLTEVRRWLDADPRAHDWTVCVRGALAAEGADTSDTAVQAREDALRSKVAALKSCDLTRPDPLGDGATYDLVTSFYTAECAAADRADWERVMRHLASLVRPGGTLFQVALRDSRWYAVLDRWFPVVPVTEADFAAVLPRCGFDPAHTTITSVRVGDWAAHGFDGICVVTAVKSATPAPRAD